MKNIEIGRESVGREWPSKDKRELEIKITHVERMNI